MTKQQKLNNIFKITFISLVVFGVSWFLIDLFINGTNTIMNVIFLRGQDSFMDFFNSIRDAKDLGVYPERHVIYPAFANCIYFILGLFIPKELVETSFQDRMAMLSNPLSIMTLITYYILVFLLFIYIMNKSFKNKTNKYLCMIIALFSFPFIYGFERANIILIAVIALIGYFMLRESENKWLRELSYILFGVSFALKLYPIIFIIIPLVEKKYKEVIKLAIYSFILFVVPFLFYGGINAIFTMLRNILDFSNNKTDTTDLNNIYLSLSPFLQTFISPNLPGRMSTLVLLFLVFLYVMFSKNDTYLKAYLGCILLINVPGGEQIYSVLFYLVPLFMLIEKKDKNYLDFAYLLLIIIMFLPLPISFLFNDKRYYLYYIAIPITNIVMILMLLVTSTIDYVKAIQFKIKKRGEING